MYPYGLSPTKDTIYRFLYYSEWTPGKLTNMQLFADGKFYTGKNMEHKVLIGTDFGSGNEGQIYNWGESKFPLAINNPTYYLPKDSLTLNDADNGYWLATNRWQALYVQDHLKLFDKLILTLAGRFTQLTTGFIGNDQPADPDYEITDNKFTPRLGLTYMFSKNVSAYIMHDESFLAQAPATPADAKGLLKSAIRDEDPVVFIEGEMLYNMKGDVPDAEYVTPIGLADVKRPGRDATIICHSKTVGPALKAAEELAAAGIEAEVIDLRTIRPLDERAVLESVARTNRCVIAEEGWPFAGVGAQVVDLIQREVFDALDAPVLRVTGADVPMPYNKLLERAAKVDAGKIVAAVKRVAYVA
jgi:hypothetical protein